MNRDILLRWGKHVSLLLMLAGIVLGILSPAVYAEGSADLYRDGAGSRASLEWRTSSYGNALRRRTLLHVYARSGEYVLLGSSAVDVPDTPDLGDIRVYDPGLITGPIGEVTIPATPSYNCLAQRTATKNLAQGRISSRVQEQNGPRPIADLNSATPTAANPNGYIPCFYQAPVDGIYSVVLSGPAGMGVDSDTKPSGSIADTPNNFNASQDTTVALWDVTVRSSLGSPTDLRGRLFAYYLALYTGDNGRPVNSEVQVVTRDGFRYKVDLRGMDPNGFVLYGNQVGFLDSDGTPLYHDVLADPNGSFQEQNQLFRIQGGAQLAPANYPIFFDTPDNAALAAIGIPLDSVLPTINNLSFSGSGGVGLTAPGDGGNFTFESNVTGVYELVISRDGIDFDPAAPQNRSLRGVRIPGSTTTTIAWDGRDNSGDLFPAGSNYRARMSIHGGEFHFPFLDVENSISGSPMIELTNPPDANSDGVRDANDCPNLNGGCFGAVYDDRGYRSANGTLVGTAINGPLCPNNAGAPPIPLVSGRRGYDSRTAQRAYGFPSGGNPDQICASDGGFGDKKGLDLWTFYPSNELEVPFRIVAPLAVDLANFTATHNQNSVVLRWETRTEFGTLGYQLLRSPAGRDQAVLITPSLIPARGTGASYNWNDSDAQAGNRYWLVAIDADGSWHEYGPISVASAPSSGGTMLWLPLLAR